MNTPVGDPAVTETVESVFRQAHGQAVATLIRVFGDITLAEDAVQDAFVVATEHWAVHGIPPNPAGWIVTTARNRAIDVLRRTVRGRELHQQTQADTSEPTGHGEEPDPEEDDRLRLIFTCCHPALRTEHQIALTLRLLGGLSVSEIARAFLISDAAVAKRLVRAKHKIKAARIPYRVPRPDELGERVDAVLAVLYLIYNAGLESPENPSVRAEAIRLARALVALLPGEPEAAGLLALMLLSEARASTRFAEDSIVLLRDQDRTRWDRNLIAEGHALVRSCIRRGRPGPYQLQAAIQAVHCDAKSFEATDWGQIAALYDHLHAIAPTAVVALNRAIAKGEVEGARTGLQLIDQVAEELDHYHLMHAGRGTFLERLGALDAARDAFERALGLASTEHERQFLALRAAHVTADGSDPRSDTPVS